MKKLLCLFLLVACALVLVSCTLPFGNDTCQTHIDNNGDLKCDVCSTEVPCESHKDKDGNLKCDKCDADVECSHKDLNNDGACDIPSCDYMFCEHEYASEYSHNKTHHYFLPTCDCNIDPKDEAPHTDVNNDGVCDGCKWNYNHRHTYDDFYTHDATHHWYAASCGHDAKKGYALHEDKENDGICDVCYWDYDHEHTYSESWTTDKTHHWHDVSCGHSVDVKDNGEHKDSDNNGLCDVCSWNYDHEHTYNTSVWVSDEEKHWHEADCGHTVPGIDVENHADSDQNGECDACEYNVCGPNHTIDHTKWEWNEEKHWKPSICGHDTPNCTMEAQGHQWNDEGTECSMCGYNNGHVHTYDETVWESTNDGHQHRYSCHTDYLTPLEPHNDPDNDGVCNICNYQFCNHEFDDFKWVYEEGGTTHWHPTVCNHNIPNNKKDEAEHEDLIGNDGVCDVCEYQICKHPQLPNEYSSDATHHWNKFTCTHDVVDFEKTAHEDTDDNNDGVCDICSYQYCNHPQSETEYTSDRTHHWFAFTECEHVVPEDRKTAHTDENNIGECSVCGIYCTHTFDTENWSTDADTHFHKATCGHDVSPIDIEKHADADSNNDGVCDTCEYIYCEHTWSDEWSSDETGHWYAVTCGHNVDVAGFATHVDNIGNDGICDICEYQICNHTYDTEGGYLSDKNYHWYAITCGHALPETAKKPHDDNDGDGYCTTCESQFCAHEYDDEVYIYDGTHHWYATTCGHPVPESTKQSHLDENNDGFCEICNNQYCVHTEESATVLDKNDTHHWNKYVDCGHIDYSTKEAHTDAADHNGACDICEKEFNSGDLDVDTNNPIETPPFVPTSSQQDEE